jgi:hypothetical protein
VLQLSVAVTTPEAGGNGIALQSTLTFDGMFANIGAVVSVTVIVCVAVVLFPHRSVAVQVLVIIEEPKQEPAVFITTGPVTVAVPQLSLAVTTPAPGTAGIALHWTIRLAGIPDNTGGVVSVTVIICEAEAELPHKSVAVQVLVIL